MGAIHAGVWFLGRPRNSYSRPHATRPTSGVHGEARGAATRGQAAAYRAHGSPRAVSCPPARWDGRDGANRRRDRPSGRLWAPRVSAMHGHASSMSGCRATNPHPRGGCLRPLHPRGVLLAHRGGWCGPNGRASAPSAFRPSKRPAWAWPGS